MPVRDLAGWGGVELAISVLAPGRDMEAELKTRVRDSLARNLSEREL